MISIYIFTSILNVIKLVCIPTGEEVERAAEITAEDEEERQSEWSSADHPGGHDPERGEPDTLLCGEMCGLH